MVHARILRYYQPFGRGILAAFVLLILSIGFNLLKPWPVKYVVDSLLVGDHKLPWWIPAGSFGGALLSAVLLLIAIHLLWGVLNMAANFWLIEIGLKALLRFRTECFQKFHALSMRYHDGAGKNDLAYRAAYDTQSIQTFFNRGFGTIVGSVLTLAGILIVMWQMNQRLTLLSCAVVPFLIFAISFFAGKVRRDSRKLQEKESRVLHGISESLQHLMLFRLLNQGARQTQEFTGTCTDAMEASRELNRTNLASTLVVGVITACGGALLLYFGAQEVEAGRLLVGDLWVFLSYLAMFYQPLEQLSYTAWAMEGAAAGAERVFEVLDELDVEEEGESDLTLDQGTIRFEHVSFSYENQQWVLHDIDLEIPGGSTVAFVGGTGAGKTTLLALLPRLYRPQSGRVWIDGQDISRVGLSSLRTALSVVTQETELIKGTVRDNLLLASPTATDTRCWDALEQAQAAEFVESLPGKLEYPIGDEGVRLSGGQRQRLGISRAILRASPILLMDEPTSALDTGTEARLVGAMERAGSRPTTLIITHRLATIHHLETIYVMERGRIVESGSGAQLLKRGGAYAKLWNPSGT